MICVYSKNGCFKCEDIKKHFVKAGLTFSCEIVTSLSQVVRMNPENSEEDFDKITSFPVIIQDEKVYTYDEALDKFGEPILDTRNNRPTLFPITEHDMFEMYKKSRASFWQPEEISFAKDDTDLESLSADELHFINHILAFFASSDRIVLQNLNVNFKDDIQIQEALHFYAVQSGIEAIHSETYSLLIDRYVKNDAEKHKLYYAVNDIPSVKAKADWVERWTNDRIPFAQRLFAFACVEGILFSGAFCAIYWLKDRGLLPGLCFANELISRDEGLHTMFGVMLYKRLKNRLSVEKVVEIISDVVKHEKEFITESIPCSLIGMNSGLMSKYIEYVADRLIMDMGYKPLYNSKCPFEFMEKISLTGKTNFFEKKVGDYAKAGVMAQKETQVFSMDEDF